MDESTILDSLSFNVVKLQSFGLSKRRKFSFNSATKTLEAEKIGEKGKDEWNAAQLLEIRRLATDDSSLELLTKDSSKACHYKFRSFIEREAFCSAVHSISPTTTFCCDAENYANYPNQISFSVELPSIMLGTAEMNITIDFRSRSIEFTQAGSSQSSYHLNQVEINSGCGRRLDFVMRLKGGKLKRASVLFKSIKFRERFIGIFNSAIHSLDLMDYPREIVGETLVVSSCTWNVGDKKPPADLNPLLRPGSADIYVIGLQECSNKQKWLKSIQKCLNSEDGLMILKERIRAARLLRIHESLTLAFESKSDSPTSSVPVIISPFHLCKTSRIASAACLSAATTFTSSGNLPLSPSSAKKTQRDLQSSLSLNNNLNEFEASCVADDEEEASEDYRLLNVTSLWDIHIAVFVKSSLLPRIAGVNYGSQATGYANLLGNKGAAGVGLIIDSTTSLAFVTSHLAARATRISQRQDNLENISSGLKLDGLTKFPPSHVDFVNQFDFVFWMGDFNYRVDLGNHGSEDEFNFCMKFLKQERFQELIDRDQFKTQSTNGCIMAEFVEGPIRFCPTYRWVKGGVEFSNKKNQNPSYCDRVFYKRPMNSGDISMTDYDAVFKLNQSDHRPVSGKFEIRLLPPTVMTIRPNPSTIYDSCFIVLRKVELALTLDLSPAKCKTIRYTGFDGSMSFVVHSSFLTSGNACGCGGGEVVSGISPGSGIGATNGGAAAGFSEGSGGGSGGIDACGRPVPCWNSNACRRFAKACKSAKSPSKKLITRSESESKGATDDDDDEYSRDVDDDEKSLSFNEYASQPELATSGSHQSTESDTENPDIEPPVWKWPARQIEFIHPVLTDDEMLSKQRLVLVFKKTSIDGPVFGVTEVPLTNASKEYQSVQLHPELRSRNFSQTLAADKLFVGLSHAPTIRSEIYDDDEQEEKEELASFDGKINLERKLTAGYSFETKLILHGKQIGVVRGEIGIIRQSNDSKVGNIRKLSLADSLLRLERAISTSQKIASASQPAVSQVLAAESFVMTPNAMMSVKSDKSTSAATVNADQKQQAAEDHVVPVESYHSFAEESSESAYLLPPETEPVDGEVVPPQLIDTIIHDNSLPQSNGAGAIEDSTAILESKTVEIVDNSSQVVVKEEILIVKPPVRTKEDDAQEIIERSRLDGPKPNAIAPYLRKRISKIISVRALVVALRTNKQLVTESKTWSQMASDNLAMPSMKVRSLLADLDSIRSTPTTANHVRDYDGEVNEQSEGESDDENYSEKIKRLKKEKKATESVSDSMINQLVQNAQLGAQGDMIKEVWLEGDTVCTIYGTSFHKTNFKCSLSGVVLFDHEFVFWERQPYLKTAYLKNSAKNFCCGCMERIQYTELCVSAGGFRFHTECFRCHHTGRILRLHEPYYEKSGNFYCKESFVELFHTCARCLEGVPLREEEQNHPSGKRGIRALGKIYHADCFSCNFCSKKISGDSFFSMDQQNGQGLQPYCEKCYARNFLSACSGCGEAVLPTDGDALIACGSNWHRDHFRCAASGIILTNEYFEHMGLPYCTEKFYELHANRCNRCSLPLRVDVSVISVGNNLHYHTDCFRCSVDDVPLPFVDNQYVFFEHDMQVFCQDHYIDNICSDCIVCGLKVVHERVSFLRHFIHPHCMNCQSCRVSLLRTSAYAGSNGLPYCHKCFTEFFSSSCAACGFVIAADQNPVRAIADKIWHPDHFICVICRRNLVGIEYFEHSSMPFCKQCFLPRFGVRCGTCYQRIISGEQLIHVKAANNYYHVTCYKCFCCERQISATESIFVKNDRLFCQECYTDVCVEIVCNYCGQAIASGPKVMLRGGTLAFHKQCTICFECKKIVGPASTPPNSVQMFVRTEAGVDDLSLLACEEHMGTRHSKLSQEGQERISGQFPSVMVLRERRRMKGHMMSKRSSEFIELENGRKLEIEICVDQSKKFFEEIVQTFSGDMRMSAMSIIKARRRRSSCNDTVSVIPLPLESLLLKQSQAFLDQKLVAEEEKRQKMEEDIRIVHAERKAAEELEISNKFREEQERRLEEANALQEAEKLRVDTMVANIALANPEVVIPEHASDEKVHGHVRTGSGRQVHFSDDIPTEFHQAVTPIVYPSPIKIDHLHKSPSPPPMLPMSPLPNIESHEMTSGEKHHDGSRISSVSFKSDIVMIGGAQLESSLSPTEVRSRLVDSDSSLSLSIKKSGYLSKKSGESSFFRKAQWQRRYFVLDVGLLTYYKSEEDCVSRRVEGNVPRGREVVEGANAADSFEFSIMPGASTKGDTVLQQQLALKADTDHERRDWMRALSIWMS